jgi:two-component SAPR family response regulator
MEAQKVDLLVTDVIMPDVNGFMLARQARELHPEITLIYMSGYYTEAQRRSGPNGLMLTKPFRPAILLANVAKEIGPPASE